MKNIILTPRLQKIASLVPQCSVVADVGTDHAYIPVYCVINNICSKAIAMDINEGPLKNASETVNSYGVCKSVELRLSDGLCALDRNEADTVVIAGMGGLLIKTILQNGIGDLKKGTFLILQPMLAQKELREYLYQSGNSIEGEFLAKEGNKIYNIITARVGLENTYTEYDCVVGRKVKDNSAELFEFYKDKEINVRRKILKGLSMARTKDLDLISSAKREISFFEE